LYVRSIKVAIDHKLSVKISCLSFRPWNRSLRIFLRIAILWQFSVVMFLISHLYSYPFYILNSQLMQFRTLFLITLQHPSLSISYYTNAQVSAHVRIVLRINCRKKYEGVSKSFRTGHLEQELQMVQVFAI